MAPRGGKLNYGGCFRGRCFFFTFSLFLFLVFLFIFQYDGDDLQFQLLGGKIKRSPSRVFFLFFFPFFIPRFPHQGECRKRVVRNFFLRVCGGEGKGREGLLCCGGSRSMKYRGEFHSTESRGLGS